MKIVRYTLTLAVHVLPDADLATVKAELVRRLTVPALQSETVRAIEPIIVAQVPYVE